MVFRIGDLDDEEVDNQENENPQRLIRRLSTIDDTESNNYGGTKRTLHGVKLCWQQFYGLIVKRFIYTKRRYLLYGILALIPPLICIILQVCLFVVRFCNLFLITYSLKCTKKNLKITNLLKLLRIVFF